MPSTDDTLKFHGVRTLRWRYFKKHHGPLFKECPAYLERIGQWYCLRGVLLKRNKLIHCRQAFPIYAFCNSEQKEGALSEDAHPNRFSVSAP